MMFRVPGREGASLNKDHGALGVGREMAGGRGKLGGRVMATSLSTH